MSCLDKRVLEMDVESEGKLKVLTLLLLLLPPPPPPPPPAAAPLLYLLHMVFDMVPRREREKKLLCGRRKSLVFCPS